MTTKDTGQRGEDIAAAFLEQKGYKILERSFVNRLSGPQAGEVDIIAKKGDIIRFVEVKALTSGNSFFPEAKVNYSKQKKLIRSAQLWMAKNRVPFDSKWSIEVVSIVFGMNGEKPQIRHLENAVFC